MSFKIKKLDFKKYEPYSDLGAIAAFGGKYTITEYCGLRTPFKVETHGWFGGFPSGYYDTLEEAISACQLHFESEIEGLIDEE